MIGRKVFSILAFSLLVMATVFAASNYSLNIKGYYEPHNVTEEEYLSIAIYDSDGNRVFQTATIDYSPENVGEKYDNLAFKIKLSGNFTGKIAMKLTFSPMRAYVGGIYYIPKHRFTLWTGAGKWITRMAEFNLTQGNSADKSYTKFENVTYKNNTPWELNYNVVLVISEFSQSAGDFIYTSNVKVEVGVE